MNPIELPRLDRRPADARPRLVQFHDPGRLGRRGFLAVLGAGAITLGMTMLGWIPLSRPARAEPGTEFLDCGTYYDGVGGPICVGAPYSPGYCGEDKWFKTGCYRSATEAETCYQPTEFCEAAGPDNETRNAWRWESENIVYRCADGQVYWAGAPNPETVICNAKLAPARQSSTAPTAPPSSTPPSSTPPSSTPLPTAPPSSAPASPSSSPTPRTPWSPPPRPVPEVPLLPPLTR